MNRQIDLPAFVTGATFTGIGLWWLIDRFVDIDLPRTGWVVAAALIVLGLFGLVRSLRRPPS